MDVTWQFCLKVTIVTLLRSINLSSQSLIFLNAHFSNLLVGCAILFYLKKKTENRKQKLFVGTPFSPTPQISRTQSRCQQMKKPRSVSLPSLYIFPNAMQIPR